MTPITDLAKDLSKEELLDDEVEIGTALDIPAETFVDGDPIYGVLQIFSEQFSKIWNAWVAPAIRAGFLDFATGPWLSLKAALDYDTPRKESAFATTRLYVENRGGGVYTLNPGNVRVQNEDGKTFKNTSTGSLGAWGGSGPYPKVLLDFEADEAGSASNTPIGGIQTTPVSAPSGVFAQTNTSPILGQDEEEDAPLVKRARLATAPLSPAGPKAAYEYIALSAKRADGTSVDVTRAKAVDAGNSTVKVYCAGASGATLGDMSTPETDIFIVYTELLKRVKPVGFKLEVYGATEKAVEFDLALVIDRAVLLTQAEAEIAAAKAVDDFFRRLPIGGHRITEDGPGYVFKDEVQAKASESADGIIRATTDADGDLAEDFELQPHEVAVPSYAITAALVSQ